MEGRAAVVDALREAAEARRALAPGGDDDPAAWIVARALRELGASLAPSLRPVINATGVIIHTNLGRAPLAEAAVARAAGVAAGYSNLEYDVASAPVSAKSWASTWTWRWPRVPEATSYSRFE